MIARANKDQDNTQKMDEGAISTTPVEGGDGDISIACTIKKKVGVEENPMIGQSSCEGVAATPTVHTQIDSTSILSENKISNIDILAESLRKAGTFMYDQSAVKDMEQFQGTEPGVEEDGEVMSMSKKKSGRPRRFLAQPATLKDKIPTNDGTPKRRRGRPKKKVRQPRKRPRESDGEAGTSSPKKMKEQVAEETGQTPAGESGSEEVPKKRRPGRPRKSDSIKSSTSRIPIEGKPAQSRRVRPKRNSSLANNRPTVVETLENVTVVKKSQDQSSTNPAGIVPTSITSPSKTEMEEELKELPVCMQASNSPSKLPGHHLDSPLKARTEGMGQDMSCGRGGEGMEKLQVSSSESDSEGSEKMGDGTDVVTLPPTTCKEPPLINKSFDEDALN